MLCRTGRRARTALLLGALPGAVPPVAARPSTSCCISRAAELAVGEPSCTREGWGEGVSARCCDGGKGCQPRLWSSLDRKMKCTRDHVLTCTTTLDAHGQAQQDSTLDALPPTALGGLPEQHQLTPDTLGERSS